MQWKLRYREFYKGQRFLGAYGGFNGGSLGFSGFTKGIAGFTTWLVAVASIFTESPDLPSMDHGTWDTYARP